jgi:hypothetical protein
MMQSFPPAPDFGNAAVRELVDKIAIAAMQAMLVNGYDPTFNGFHASETWHPQLIANNAYAMTRAMLTARDNFNESQAQMDGVK